MRAAPNCTSLTKIPNVLNRRLKSAGVRPILPAKTEEIPNFITRDLKIRALLILGFHICSPQFDRWVGPGQLRTPPPATPIRGRCNFIRCKIYETIRLIAFPNCLMGNFQQR